MRLEYINFNFSETERLVDNSSGRGRMAPKRKIPEWEYFEERDGEPLVVYCTIPGCTQPRVKRGGVAGSLSTNGMG